MEHRAPNKVLINDSFKYENPSIN
jgi:hypothetical protein